MESRVESRVVIRACRKLSRGAALPGQLGKGAPGDPSHDTAAPVLPLGT